MARKQPTQTIQVTVTDEQYQEFLAIRLAAMKGFEAGTVDEVTMKAARAAVRRARKVRRAESAQLEALREQEAQKAEARSQAAKKAAATRASKRQQPQEQEVPVAA